MSRPVEESLAALFSQCEVARRSAKPSPHSERAARSDFTAIHALLRPAAGAGDDLTLAEVNARRLRAAFARFATTHAAASITRCWSTWNRFYGFLLAEGVVAANPMLAVPHPTVARPAPKPLHGDDADVLLETVAAGVRPARWPWPERDLAFLATAILAGLRLCELLALNVGSIDRRAGERRVHVVGEGGRERAVPIEESLHDVIERYVATRRERFPAVDLTRNAPLFVDRRGDRLKRGGAHYLVERCYRAAGLADRVPAGAMVHALRHTYATRLAEDGATATEIQTLLGHERLNASHRYIEASAERTDHADRAKRTYGVLERLTAEGAPATRRLRKRSAAAGDGLPGIRASAATAGNGGTR